jgi:predicted small metal-binding protein
MKAFACGDVVPGCDARWVCSTEDEILTNVASHAREIHGIAVLPFDLELQVRDRIATTV